MSFNITAQYFLDDVEVPNSLVTGRLTIQMKFIPFLNQKRMLHPRTNGTISLSKQIAEPQLEDGLVRIYPFNGLELRITCQPSEDAAKLYQQVVERYEKNTQAASPAPTISPQKSTEEAEQNRKRKRHVDDVFEHMSSQGREELTKFSAPSAKRRDIDSMTTSVPERNSLGREAGRIMRREPQPPSSVLQRRPSNPPQDSSIYGGYRPSLAFGLQNLGNTCYLNAVTQAVSSLREFVDDLRSMPKQLPEVTNGALFQRTVEILTRMQATNSLPVALSPAKLREQIAIAAPMFRGNGQQDAHEFFLEYMNQLHDELLRAHQAFEAKHGKGEEHVLATQSHFDALVERQLTCVQCGQARTVLERFRDFSLDFSGSTHAEQLPTMLRRYFQPELLEAKCEHCNAAEANLDTNLREAPRVLVLHLKRFVPDMEKQCYEKQHQAVDIPGMLDLGATLSGNAVSASPPRLPARPLAPLAVPAPESPETSPVKETTYSHLRYGLRAIVAHEGASPRSGHYVCYAKSSSGPWFLYDDSRVTRLPQEPRDLGRKAYMLFYVLNGAES